MAKYVVAAVKSWNIENYHSLASNYTEDEFTLITDRKKLTYRFLERLKPRYVFFPHWSWHIPENIYSCFGCVVFHMTDLPFGRGGSPLQNLLVRGIYKTQVSALKAGAGMDSGDIYFKEPVDISEGNADDILRRISDIVFHKMIPVFLNQDPVPKKQEGTPVFFKRRTSEQSEIPDGLSQRQLYDYIRMLDGEGYPAAYRKVSDGRVYFRNARFENNAVYADAEFRRDV